MLGLRMYLAWGKVESGSAANHKEWLEFCNLHENIKQNTQSVMRGDLIYQEMNEVLQYNLMHITFCTWLAAFMGLEVLIGARAYLADGPILFCKVNEEGQLL